MALFPAGLYPIIPQLLKPQTHPPTNHIASVLCIHARFEFRRHLQNLFSGCTTLWYIICTTPMGQYWPIRKFYGRPVAIPSFSPNNNALFRHITFLNNSQYRRIFCTDQRAIKKNLHSSYVGLQCVCSSLPTLVTRDSHTTTFVKSNYRTGRGIYTL